MKYQLKWIMWILLLLSSCADVEMPPEQMPIATASRASLGVQVVQVRGAVTVQRANSAEHVAMQSGIMLYANDTVWFDSATDGVAVLCKDGSTWSIPQQMYHFEIDDCPSARNDLNQLVVLQGAVELRYRGAGDFYPAVDGTLARRGDEIRVSNSADAYVVCGTKDVWRDIPREQAVDIAAGCPRGECVLCLEHDDAHVPRAGLDPQIPYIITPRSTRLLTQTPLLRWNQVEGATEYTVTIEGGDLDWQVTTNDTQIQYAGSPPLVAGETYWLSVATDNGRASNEEGTTLLSFRVVDTTDAAQIQVELDAISSLALSPSATALSQSIVYTQHYLRAEAITLLESSEPRPTTQRLLGDLYRQIGLVREAHAAYLAGLELESDPRTQATLYEGLGETYAVLGLDDSAENAYQQAQRLYEISGDFGLATAIENR